MSYITWVVLGHASTSLLSRRSKLWQMHAWCTLFNFVVCFEFERQTPMHMCHWHTHLVVAQLAGTIVMHYIHKLAVAALGSCIIRCY